MAKDNRSKDFKNLNSYDNDGSYAGMMRKNLQQSTKIAIDFEIAYEKAQTILAGHTIKMAIGSDNQIYFQGYFPIDWDDRPLDTPKRIKKSLKQLTGISYPKTASHVDKALKILLNINERLASALFSWQDFPSASFIPKQYRQSTQTKTIGEILEEYEAYYWATHDSEKWSSHRTWNDCRKTYHRYLPKNEPFSDEAIESTIVKYKSTLSAKKACVQELKRLCKFAEFDYKNWQRWMTSYKSKLKPELTDEQIIDFFYEFKRKKAQGGSNSQHQLWQWMYGMMAVYGLRNHEVFNIQNLDRPFKILNTDIVLPAFTDSSDLV